MEYTGGRGNPSYDGRQPARNDTTGERIVTKHRSQDKYRTGYENIKWSKEL